MDLSTVYDRWSHDGEFDEGDPRGALDWILRETDISGNKGFAEAEKTGLLPVLEVEGTPHSLYALGSDYLLYARHCRQATDQARIPLIGDSVIWGHYVPPGQTLSHHLNVAAGETRFANLGLDGTHPAALGGLIEHYGEGLAGRAAVLHFNPLWITSTKHDLQTEKEFHFNHPSLVPQFETRIPCYKAPVSQRVSIVMRRRIPLSQWLCPPRRHEGHEGESAERNHEGFLVRSSL